MTDPRPLLAVLAPLAALALIAALRRRPAARDAASIAAALAQFGLLASMVPETLAGAAPSTAPLRLTPAVHLLLRADALGLLFGLVASGLWAVTVLYARGYLGATGDRRQTAFFAALAVCLCATVGLALAGNLLTFVLFYEVLTIATYPLVTHTRTKEAVAAGRKYLAYTLAGGQLLLAAAVWATVLAPGADFTPGGFLAGKASAPALLALFALFAAGVGVKAAVMPLHGWLPAAMVAPVPVSALLHAVAVVKAGAFGYLRVTGFVFGPDLLRDLGASQVVAWLAAATIILASLRAISEKNIKRRLAYSTIGQLSYIVLGASIGTTAALAGAAFHIAAHGLMKITLFFCAGALYARDHISEVAELKGVGRRMPATMGAFAVAALGLAGLPAAAGFVSKWNLGVGALRAGEPEFLAVLLVSGLLNLAYFFPMVHSAFFGDDRRVEFDEPRFELWLAPVLTAAGAVALGLLPHARPSLLSLAWAAARSCAGGAP